MKRKKIKVVNNFKSIWDEGTIRYLILLSILLFTVFFESYLIIKGLLINHKIDITLIIMILAEFFSIKLLIWQFKTIFIYTSPFYTTNEGIVFTQFFNNKTILWDNVLEIDLDSSIDVNTIIGKHTRRAIIFTLNNGKLDYVLKNKAYKNIDDFIELLKTNFPEKIKDPIRRGSLPPTTHK